jgi:hypothetical protein
LGSSFDLTFLANIQHTKSIPSIKHAPPFRHLHKNAETK